MVATEMLYFLVGSRELDGGAMVTASHNPKAYTGVKLVREGALALSGDAGIGEVRASIEAGLPRRRPAAARSRRSTSTTTFSAARWAFIDPDAIKPLRSSSTAATGWPGRWSARCSSASASIWSTTYWVPDGEFPDHEPNPLLPENRRVHHRQGARARAPTSGSPGTATPTAASSSTTTGEFVDGDFLTALLAQQVLAQGAGRDDPLRRPRQPRGPRHGRASSAARSHVNRVGHAFFKIAMREHAAAFGGEVSGHYYFRDFWCADSGTIPALLVLELLSTRGPAALRAGRRRFARATSSPARSTPRSPTRRRRCRSSRSATPTAEVSWLDGVSVDYPDWHFNVRPSNTEPLLRLNLESLVSREDMEAKRDEVLALIRA